MDLLGLDNRIRVAIVANPRPGDGAERRLETMVALGRALEADVAVIRPRRRRQGHGVAAVAERVVGGSVVPEVVAWDVADTARRLTALNPHVVVFETARAYHPDLSGPWLSVLDLVDRLSVSYRQRSEIETGWRRAGYRVLSGSHRRFERQVTRSDLVLLAAGRNCARELGAAWVPNVVDAGPVEAIDSASGSSEASPSPTRATLITPTVSRSTPPLPPAGSAAASDPVPDHDAVFFGTLDYPPNVDALLWLAEGGPGAGHLRLLVAGRRPGPMVRDLCRHHRWTLVTDYRSVEELATRATVSVVPLRAAAGIQNKILESAMVGLPVVATSAALSGFDPALPLDPVDDHHDFLDETLRLARDPLAAGRQAEALSRHVARTYVTDVVVGALAEALGLGADLDPQRAKVGACW